MRFPVLMFLPEKAESSTGRTVTGQFEVVVSRIALNQAKFAALLGSPGVSFAGAFPLDH